MLVCWSGRMATRMSMPRHPPDARKVANADVVFVNGLGFEGWLDRLVKASGTKAPIQVVSRASSREKPRI